MLAMLGALFSLILIAPGCGINAVNKNFETTNQQLGKTNQHLDSMDRSTEKLSTEIVNDREHLKAYQEHLKVLTQQMTLMQESIMNMNKEITQDGVYLKSVTEHLGAMSGAITDMQKIGKEAFASLMKLVTDSPTPPLPGGENFSSDPILSPEEPVLPHVPEETKPPAIAKKDMADNKKRKQKDLPQPKREVPEVVAESTETAPPAQINKSEEVIIPTGTACFDADAKTVHRFITDYKHYINVPGATYGIGGLPAARMVQVLSKFVRNDSAGTKALILLTIRPWVEENPKYYPTGYLGCDTDVANEGRTFTQDCHLITTNEDFLAYGGKRGLRRYGLTALTTHVKDVVEMATLCNGGAGISTRFTYDITLGGDPKEIQEIREQILTAGLNRLFSSALDSVFGAKTFFPAYFTNFYTSWLASFPGWLEKYRAQ